MGFVKRCNLYCLMNTIINKTKLHAAASALAIAAMVLSLVPMQAFAQANGNGNGGNGGGGNPNANEVNPQVTLCHSTASPTNPYNDITTDAKSIVNLPNGHDSDADDIIPSFQYNFGAGLITYPGKNLTTTYTGGVTGQQILNNGCDIPTVTPVDVCPNISGAQATVPTGYEIVGGQCLLIVVDQCPLVDGVQTDTTLCPPVIDMCPLVDGIQTNTILCPPVVDQCPLVDGVQTDTTLCPPVVDQCPLVDGVQTDTTLCPPVVDQCPLVDGVQTDTTLCPPAPTTCTVVITSDTADYVVEKSANAQLLTFIHGNWTAMFGAASWIWGDNPVVDPTVSETQTFRKQFGFVGTVTSATLEVASDNTHTATLNTGAANAGGSTFNAPVSYNVATDVAQGNNTLTIGVTNTGVPASSATSNPAGLKYRLTIQGTPTTDADCAVPFVTDICPNIQGDQATLPDNHVIVGENCVPIVNGCTNPLATNYNAAATPANPQATACTLNYVSQCGANPNLLTNGSFELPGLPSNNSWSNLDTVTGWTYDFGPGLEVWRGLSGFLASNGLHHVELDGNAATTISQATTTILGATYELRFDLAARSGTAAANNAVLATAGTATIVSTSTGNTNWTTYGGTFVADSNSTTISLADIGAPLSDSYGTLIDNVQLCLVRDPNGGGDDDDDEDVDTYRLQGYVWHDDNENQDWDSEFIPEQETTELLEDPLAGWTVNITDGKTTLSTTTDSEGYYYFEVPAGTWTITEVVQDGWGRTTQESHVVTVPIVPEVTLLDSIVDFVIPTAHAAVLDSYGDYDFGNNETRRGGGGGGGNRAGDRDGEVLGDSDSVTPEPLVLGEQTSAVPTGAPNTGKGGSATVVMGQFLALPRRRN